MRRFLPHVSSQLGNHDFISRLLGRSIKFAILLAAAWLLVRVLTALWLHRYFAASVDDLAKVTGMDKGIASWLHGLAMMIMALSLTPLFLRWGFGLVIPGCDARRTLQLTLVALAISGLLVMAPPLVRVCRGVDQEGLPDHLLSVDPASSRWFAPDNRALIAVSFERDGSWEFWNRPGTTPQSAVDAIPVSAKIREEWERRQEMQRSNEERKKREAEARARQEAERIEQLRLDQEKEQQEAKRLAEAQREAAARQERIELEARTRVLTEEAKIERARQEAIRAKSEAEARKKEASVTAEKERAARERQQILVATRVEELPWQSHPMKPNQYRYVNHFVAPVAEISLPTECVIEVEGAPAYRYPAGISRIRLGPTRNFRVSSSHSRKFEFKVRPAQD